MIKYILGFILLLAALPLQLSEGKAVDKYVAEELAYKAERLMGEAHREISSGLNEESAERAIVLYSEADRLLIQAVGKLHPLVPGFAKRSLLLNFMEGRRHCGRSIGSIARMMALKTQAVSG